jgi:hypothetical protein
MGTTVPSTLRQKRCAPAPIPLETRLRRQHCRPLSKRSGHCRSPTRTRIRTTRRQGPFGFGKSRDLCLGSHPEAMLPASVGSFQLGYMQCVYEVEASAPRAMWNFRLQCTLASVETRTWNQPWEDTQMRLSLICSIMAVLSLVALAPSSATAETGNMTGRYHYAACSCQFGYPGRACVPAVACGAEGGRCSGTCVPQPPEPVSE